MIIMILFLTSKTYLTFTPYDKSFTPYDKSSTLKRTNRTNTPKILFPIQFSFSGGAGRPVAARSGARTAAGTAAHAHTLTNVTRAQ